MKLASPWRRQISASFLLIADILGSVDCQFSHNLLKHDLSFSISDFACYSRYCLRYPDYAFLYIFGAVADCNVGACWTSVGWTCGAES